MKQVLFHSIYLSIIAFLSFNYWSSVQAFKAFGHLNQQLNADAKLLDKLAEVNYKGIQRTCFAYRTLVNTQLLNQTDSMLKVANQAIDFIEKNKTELHLDTINSLNYSANKPNNSFFNDAKIVEIKNKLIQFNGDLKALINNKEVDNQLVTIKNFENESYWQTLKHLPLGGVLTELSILKNKIKCDEVIMLDYFNKKSSGEMIEEDYFKTAIAPKKAVLIEGELFEAEIFLARYASNTGNNVRFIVNGQALDIQDGVAHFVGKSETIGTKTIKAEAIITNPLTGVKKTTEGSFEYQVLPKCSRDCQ